MICSPNLIRCFSFLLIGLMLLTGNACKYEDGPLIPFRSAKKRVVNSWKYQRVNLNGLNVTDGQAELAIKYSESSIGFDDEFRFTTIVTYAAADSTSFTTQYNGTWSFLEDNQKIKLQYDLPAPPSGESQTWQITRLKEKSFWAEEEVGENNYQYKLDPTN